MKAFFLLLLGMFVILPEMVFGQEERMDSVVVAPADSTVADILHSADSVSESVVDMQKIKPAFKPNSTKAILLALIPGLGQIYNQKYWKLPIVYGGLMGCIYAITWNNRYLKEYSTAYKDIVYDSQMITTNNSLPEDEQREITADDLSSSWQDLLSAGSDPMDYVQNSQFQERIKNRKDSFRRFRDMSIIIAVGVYAISIIDAYVDAQLFDFDITPDLTMRIEPVVSPQTSASSGLYGLNCSFKF